MTRTVLVAEDEAPLREALHRYLEKLGMRVLAVSDGAEAIDALKREKPDALLLDVLMPKVDGLEVLAFVRKTYPGLPVIISTNLSKGFHAEKWAELGATDCVIKSNVTLKELAEKIRGYLDD